jgi:predicted phosphodiesterase
VAKVKAVVYGHSHRFKFSQHKGIHMINLPATGYNMSGSQPVGWVEANLTDQGGEFTLHAIGGNRKNNGCCERLTWRS